MAKKMTVSVSDNLFERFETVKNKLSPSAIFQRALELAVEREERYAKQLKEDDNMSLIIERLKMEKAESINATNSLGRDDGLEWAKNSSYDAIVAAVKFEPGEAYSEMLDFSDPKADDWEISYSLYEFLEEHPELQRNDGFLSEGARNYVEGFLEAVKDFWEEVEPHLS